MTASRRRTRRPSCVSPRSRCATVWRQWRLANRPDDAEAATLDYLRTLRSFEHIARDIFANGVGPSFGSHDHFMDRFVEGMLHLGSDQLERIEEVLQHGPLLAASIQNAAEKALVERGIRVSPANLVLA